MSEKIEFANFEEFFPFYLGEHTDPLNRALHYVGSVSAVTTLALSVATLNPFLLPVVPIVGYAPAWIGHFIIEKNKPASFKHPLWSLRGDFRMLRLAATGKIKGQLAALAPA